MTLQEATNRFAQLEKDIDQELLSADAVARVHLLRKKKEYQAEQEKIRRLINNKTPSNMSVPQNQISRPAEEKHPPSSSNKSKVQRKL